MPFDQKIVIPQKCKYIICYDNTFSGAAEQIRFVNWQGKKVYLSQKENKNLLQYLIILLFIFTCTPSILTMFNINLKYPTLFTGFTLYFILGYYLNTFEINKKYRYVIYVLGLISLIVTPILTINYSILNNIHSQRFFEYGSFNIYLYSASLFLLFKNIFNKKEETKLLDWFNENHSEISREINTTKKLDDNLKTRIITLAKQYRGQE